MTTKNEIIAKPEISIIVIKGGFVYIGRMEKYDYLGDECYRITGAKCIIRWGTKKHLAQLTSGPTSETTLGDPCTVTCQKYQVYYTIDVQQEAWTKHVD